MTSIVDTANGGAGEEPWRDVVITEQFQGRTYKLVGRVKGDLELGLSFIQRDMPRSFWRRLFRIRARREWHAQPIVKSGNAGGILAFTSVRLDPQP